jgi:hypothetical protein
MLCFDHVVIQMIIFYVLLEAVISGIRNLRRNIEFIKKEFSCVLKDKRNKVKGYYFSLIHIQDSCNVFWVEKCP